MEPGVGRLLRESLVGGNGRRRLDLGCIASHGHFFFDQAASTYSLTNEERAATAFLFKLISSLPFSGTVPMIEIDAYAKWLVK